MKAIRGIALVAFFCALPIATVIAQTPAERARALFTEYREWQKREFPETATAIGDHRYDDRLSDQSPAAHERRRAYQTELLARLEAIDRGALAGQDALSQAILVSQLRNDLHVSRVFTEPAAAGAEGWLAVTQFRGPQVGGGSLPSLTRVTRFDTVQDYDNYLKRLAAVPAAIDQMIANLRVAIARGWLPPEVVVTRVPGQIESLVAAPVESSALYAPFQRIPATIAVAERERLAAAARTVLADKTFPALRALNAFYQSEYLPACRKGPGAAAQPGWKAFYEASVARMTTTALTPREIHDLGLTEVARIGGEMDAVITRSGFKGTRSEFVAWVRTSPQFYYTKSDDMLAGYREIAKRIDPELPRLFAQLPRLPYGVRAMDAAEGDNAERYIRGNVEGSRAGWVEVNVNNLSRRPKYDMVTLILHEGMPGHHLQAARALEQSDLPEFRRSAFMPAYGEGWALYAESLGEEIGVYRDPYAKFGYLSSEMFRACRLVVDTGIHALGWTRDRAIRYLVDNAAISEAFATAEVDRYYVNPAQALAYKIGELTIKRLRAKAAAALGGRFDLRRFHNALIDDGPLPLAVLEQRIDEWIAKVAQ